MIPLPATAEEMGNLSRAHEVEIPGAVIRSIGMPALVHGGPGVVEPLGVLPGMIFAAVTRASYAARARWFQPIDWSRMFRLSRGLSPAPPAWKVSDEKSPRGLEAVVKAEVFDTQHRIAPAQPGGQNRV